MNASTTAAAAAAHFVHGRRSGYFRRGMASAVHLALSAYQPLEIEAGVVTAYSVEKIISRLVPAREYVRHAGPRDTDSIRELRLADILSLKELLQTLVHDLDDLLQM